MWSISELSYWIHVLVVLFIYLVIELRILNGSINFNKQKKKEKKNKSAKAEAAVWFRFQCNSICNLDLISFKLSKSHQQHSDHKEWLKVIEVSVQIAIKLIKCAIKLINQ